jgi:CelD/BcsL family acetyltransferase involved in cellulose biosynthesis
MRLQVYTDAPVFSALRSEWNDLLADSASDTLFLTWEWQSTWWEQLGEGDLLVLVARDEGDRLLGIAPFYRTGEPGERTLSLVGCVDVSDYLDIIVRRGHEAAVYDLFLAALADYAAEWDLLSLCNIPASSPTLTHFAASARARGWLAEDTYEDVCPVISLPGTWDDYLATLNKHQRHEVRRKLRKLGEEAQSTYRSFTDGPDLAAAVDDFFALHRLSHTDKARFMDERMQRFFRAMTETLGEAGWTELCLLAIDDTPAAAMLNFRYGDRLLVYNSGYDPQYRPNLSSGIVLLSLCIQDAIHRGLRYFDFLQGNEEYKYRFGAQDTQVRRLTVTRKT